MGVYHVNELNPHLTGKQQLSVKFTKARNSNVCYSQFQAEGRGISCGQLPKFTIFYPSLPRKAAMSILSSLDFTQRNLSTGKVRSD